MEIRVTPEIRNCDCHGLQPIDSRMEWNIWLYLRLLAEYSLSQGVTVQSIASDRTHVVCPGARCTDGWVDL
jgi:hypothetical protein